MGQDKGSLICERKKKKRKKRCKSNYLPLLTSKLMPSQPASNHCPGRDTTTMYCVPLPVYLKVHRVLLCEYCWKSKKRPLQSQKASFNCHMDYEWREKANKILSKTTWCSKTNSSIHGDLTEYFLPKFFHITQIQFGHKKHAAMYMYFTQVYHIFRLQILCL